MRTVTLKPGRSKPLWHGHPWVYADSVASVEEGEGDAVRVVDAEGRTVGRGWLSERSLIRVRILDRGAEERDEDALLAARVEAAASLGRRGGPDPAATDAYRLVHAEGDGLPGLVADRYGDVVVAQFATRPVLARRARLADLLLRASGATSLVARESGREDEEGIAPDEVPFAAGGPAPAAVEIREEGVRLLVDLARGQKTGHYVDQRENRRLVAEVSRGGTVLDLYAGTGGFGLRACLAGATSVLAVDSSAAAVEAARGNAVRNGVDAACGRYEAERGDVEEVLRALRDEGRTFDVVVADPPRFASARSHLDRALKAYRELNARALSRVVPGGFLATFSCSGLLDPPGFEEVVKGAARECGRTVSIVRTLSAGPDHPVDLAAPQGRYLTGLLVRARA